MRAVDAFMLSRLRREGAGMIPGDLLTWAVAALAAGLTARARRTERDRLLLEAGALLRDLPPWTAARLLHGEIAAARRAQPAAPDTTTLRGCVAAALLMDARSLSERQIYRILKR